MYKSFQFFELLTAIEKLLEIKITAGMNLVKLKSSVITELFIKKLFFMVMSV